MVVSEESVLQRWEGAQDAGQTAIETMAMWILHYKDKQSIDTIVSGWLKVFEKSRSEKHRTVLFYVMNDAVQRAKNKHLDYVVSAFQPAVLTAISVGRKHNKLGAAMKRCIQVFSDRGVFAKSTLAAMTNMLQTEDTAEVDDGCLELNNNEVCSTIEIFEESVKLADSLERIVVKTKFPTFATIKPRIQERHNAMELLEENNVVLSTLIDARHALENQKKKGLELVETLEIAKRLYSHSIKDVAIVEDAYKKFYHGLKETRKELLEMQKTGMYPGATPPRDCPSPTDMDDPYASVSGLNPAPVAAQDNHTTTDMDMDVDENEHSQPVSFNSFLPNFARPPPNWSMQQPPAMNVPANFNLPPPQLISPGTLTSSIVPPNLIMPNLPSSIQNIPSASNLPPPSLISPEVLPRDPRHITGPFNGQSIMNPIAFSGFNSNSNLPDSAQNFPDGDAPTRDYSRNDRHDRRDSWDRGPRDPRHRGGGSFRGNRNRQHGNGYRGDRWGGHRK